MVGSGSNHWEFCEGEPRFQNTIPKKGGSGEERNPVGVASFLLVSPAGGPAHSYSCLASCI